VERFEPSAPTSPESPAAAAAPPLELDDFTARPEPGPRIDPDELDQRVQRLYQAERHFRRGDRALKRGRLADAVESFERAVELCPDEGEFLAHLGYARYQLANGGGGVSEALSDLERSCELAPKLDLTHLLRARVLRDRGDLDEARNAYEQALAANPDCQEALEGLRALSA
jgi:tetratricopeptide (TPR) repeat protein